MPEYPWLKLWSGKWLYGSGRRMTPEKRGVWVDLLALANETKFRDGSLRFDKGEPMSLDYIATILQISREMLDICLTAYKADVNLEDGLPRVQIWEDGTVFITNFWKYQEGDSSKGYGKRIEHIEKNMKDIDQRINDPLIQRGVLGTGKVPDIDFQAGKYKLKRGKPNGTPRE